MRKGELTLECQFIKPLINNQITYVPWWWAATQESWKKSATSDYSQKAVNTKYYNIHSALLKVAFFILGEMTINHYTNIRTFLFRDSMPLLSDGWYPCALLVPVPNKRIGLLILFIQLVYHWNLTGFLWIHTY